AGKTTLTKTLSGETQPTGGTISVSGDVGYLPQDSKAGDPDTLALHRVLSARGLDAITAKMRATEAEMAAEDDAVRAKAMDRYEKLEA
ncbi:ABC transporter ATP-binding protein, partial [Bacillus licheniformis]